MANDTLEWLEEHYRMTQIPEIGDAANELRALRSEKAQLRSLKEYATALEDLLSEARAKEAGA